MTAQKKPAGLSGIEAYLEAAEPRETEARLCLAGGLAVQAERLIAELDRLGDAYLPTSIADTDPRVPLVAELEKVRGRMAGAEAVFVFRALLRQAYSDLLAAHPARPGRTERWNLDTFPQALITASCIDPVMSLEQCEALHDKITEGQRDVLFTAAWNANMGVTRVPTSRVASTSPPS